MNPADAPSYASLLSLQELAARLSSQVDAAHGEIGETRAILKDAIDRLMPAFTASGPLAEASNAAAVREAAFSALQFQDISDQLLAHAQVRLTLLLREINQLAAALRPSCAGHDVEHGAAAELLRLVEQANDNLADLDISLLKPVGKAHLGAGDIEMF